MGRNSRREKETISKKKVEIRNEKNILENGGVRPVELDNNIYRFAGLRGG